MKKTCKKRWKLKMYKKKDEQNIYEKNLKECINL